MRCFYYLRYFIGCFRTILHLFTGSRARMAFGNNGAMRRALIGILFIFSFIFSYLYWNEISDTIQTTAMQDTSRRKALALREGISPRQPNSWSWVCINNHCVRRNKTQNDTAPQAAGHSLRTCNMLCGSTQLWPQPTGPVSLGSISVSFFPNQFHLELQAPHQVNEMVHQAFEIFKSNIAAMVPEDPTDFTQPSPDVLEFVVKMKIEHPDTSLSLDTKEGYSFNLHLSNDNIVATVQADTYFGARHALETMSQLIWWDDEYQNLRILKIASVEDQPMFKYRGVMLDTARNFFSVEAIKRTLDGMAASKLNTFHWHITDSQSFPFASPSVPEMVETGTHNIKHVYTAQDVREVSEYARIRGIRVIMEIDTPAHVGMGWTWGPSKGLGDLAVCVGQTPWIEYCGEPPCGQLNPNNPHVFTVLKSLYSDILELTGETQIFHLGGDEVNAECWSQYQTGTGYIDYHEVWGNYTLKALESLKQATSNNSLPLVILWSSNLTKRPYMSKYLDPEKIIVQVWNPQSWQSETSLIEDNYQMIISHVDAWYLDCGYGRWREHGEAACDPYRNWQKVYGHQPWTELKLSKEKWHLVLGGEVCLWTEQVDEISLDSRLWPRSAAFAERMWSDISVDVEYGTPIIPEDVYTRLDTHRDRLKSRGIKPAAIWPEWCSFNPGMCL